MNMGTGNGQLSVPPGFRFHPTDEELLYYYLRKKVSYEAIDLDVIREVDLNKLEPWDLKEKCRIGSGPQNEWYFFSHKDKKYPTGTRTNRATAAGFWKATGRDKAIHLSDAKRIGMRKTLVFYTGRAPHGHKTDWIMHEYRLDDNDTAAPDQQIQEEGWVVCRVFKKKNHIRGSGNNFQQEINNNNINQELDNNNNNNNISYNNNNNPHMKASGSSLDHHLHLHHHHHHQQALYDHHNNTSTTFHDHHALSSSSSSMHLPQLFNISDEPNSSAPSFVPTPLSLTSLDLDCSHSLLRLTDHHQQQQQHQRPFNGGDWTFLDKLLNNNNNNNSNNNIGHLIHHQPSKSLDHHHHHHREIVGHSNDHHAHLEASTQRLFPFQYLGCETDLLKFTK